MDTMAKADRSRLMGRIKGKNTKPELVLRKYLFARGFRFRVNYSKLPGHPDVVLPRYRTAIFVHGCFWHQHPGCKYAGVPQTRQDFWTAKFERNRSRDAKKICDIEELGWKVFVVWECEMKQDMAAVDGIIQAMTGEYPEPFESDWHNPYRHVAERRQKRKTRT